jgi:hypothetical protein
MRENCLETFFIEKEYFYETLISIHMLRNGRIIIEYKTVGLPNKSLFIK